MSGHDVSIDTVTTTTLEAWSTTRANSTAGSNETQYT